MSEIPKNKKFPVLGVTKTNHKTYGDGVYVELQLEEDAKPVKVYLPGRFKTLTDEEISEMRELPHLKLEKRDAFNKKGEPLVSPEIVFTHSKKD